jgi:gamma-glutamyltranspeptidase/glutathione hydrolase
LPTRGSPTRCGRFPRAGATFLPGPGRGGDRRRHSRAGSLLEPAISPATAPDWVDPISTSYRGHDVFELPPTTQGFVALEILNILEGYDLKALGHNSAAYLHLLVEAKRIAFADRDRYLADAEAVPPGFLAKVLSKSYAAERRKEIDSARAARSYAPARLGPEMSPGGGGRPAVEASGDTVYLTAADGKGHVISLIQSLFESFGAGIVAGETGIALQNRGSLFTLDPRHQPDRTAQALAPHAGAGDGAEGGRPFLSFGVMGGDAAAGACPESSPTWSTSA